ncbi:MAG: hypothetical protein M1831_004609 [Alyxoria varia]|nr:MAG: hypothetical protein M1831_004609 [Alyxoria varia]
MSTDAPDPRLLENWEDAFQYPIPTVRAMEKRLRTGVAENHDKLRNLVGASYRDLLGTAHTIIEIDGQLQEVEKLIGSAGKKANTRLIEKTGQNCEAYQDERRSQESDEYRWVSEVSTLERSLSTVSQILREDSSCLLAAKLLVVARLLHKSLCQKRRTQDYIGRLGAKLSSLRQKLLRHIDRRLIRHAGDNNILVEDLTAFSLASSAQPSDVLAHFYHLRSNAIARPKRQALKDTKESILRRLDLFISTIRESKILFPDLLSKSLKSLGSQPLLIDRGIVDIESLNLDVNARWFDEDVKNYTAWTRHDELARSKAEEKLKSWTFDALDTLTTAAGKDIAEESDPKAVVEVRQSIIQSWLTSSKALRILSSKSALQKLRNPFTDRLQDIMATSCTEIHDSTCKAVFDGCNANNAGTWYTPSLWDPSTLSLEYGNGAGTFRKAIVDRRLGRSHEIHAVINAFEKRAKRIQQLQTAIKEMRDTRWDDDYDDDEDNDDAEESSFQALSRSDPESLQSTLRERTWRTIQSIESDLQERSKKTNITITGLDSPGIFMYRSLRELRRIVPPFLHNIDPSQAQSLFCESLFANLRDQLAQYVTKETTPTLSTALERFFKSTSLPLRALWDTGSPPLPVQPSPATFKYLRAVVGQMEELGFDIWSPRTGHLTKRLLLDEAVRVCIEHAQEWNTNLAAEHKGTGSSEDTTESEENKTDEHEGHANDIKLVDDAIGRQSNYHGEDESESYEEKQPEQERVQDPLFDDTTLANEPSEFKQNQSSIQNTTHLLTQQQKLVQLLFDTLYLSQALSSPQSPALDQLINPLVISIDDIGERIFSVFDSESTSADEETRKAVIIIKGEADEGDRSERTPEVMGRLNKAAGEYWKRTYALFGLLVVPAASTSS